MCYSVATTDKTQINKITLNNGEVILIENVKPDNILDKILESKQGIHTICGSDGVQGNILGNRQ